MQVKDLDLFMDLVLTMPDVEAVDEIDIRMLALHEQKVAMTDPKQREEIGEEQNYLRQFRHKMVSRIEARSWYKAVRAVFGEEGFMACLDWVRAQPEGQIQQVALTNSRASDNKHKKERKARKD